ncbi:hypothetical protein Poli38472_012449 [Pythium oligandrum]|uniref:Uncharacterized protein n=1 Tax=Pythium oligandrum TaxID=41045 RepID=A0A8K1FR82_PYTOL|nr:hypothetical protein Poli38472_012449 [Pythium oligandrum]|eukprot:TMW67333.1 hypothetical protein Poli38472_012449 [Pythium oligandrum]
MDRPTRRSAAVANGHGGVNGAAQGGSSRRRRREAETASASQSDGGDTDSSSTGRSTGHRRNAKRTGATAKGKKLREDEEDGGEEEREIEEDPASEHERGKAAETHTEDEGEQSATEQHVLRSSTRARRERSQSVVSTTSDTSSILSEHTEEVHQVVYEEQLQELEKKKKMVEDGTLAEYCRRVAEFKEERNRLLQAAEWHKNLQLKNRQDLYGFEVQRAHNLWEDAKKDLKTEMLAKTDTLLLKLKRELDQLNKMDVLPTHVERAVVTKVPLTKRQMNPQPTTTEEPQLDQDSSNGSLKRQKTSVPVPDNVLRLPLDDITGDLASIALDRAQHATNVHSALAEPRLDLQIDRRRLISGKYVFEEGDEVVITSVVMKEDYIGVITSVSDDEIYIKLSGGQKVRVLVEFIASRRCEIRPFLRGSAGIESLQSSGWVECEPF